MYCWKKQLARVKQELPNLKQIYISSAIYSGYAIAGGPRHEPGAYYEGLAVKEVVDRHVGTLPWIAFGPYLWADGVVPRSDGLTWICPNDYQTDLTHPSDLGTLKSSQNNVKVHADISSYNLVCTISYNSIMYKWQGIIDG